MAAAQRKIVNVATRAIKGSVLCFIAIAAQQAHAHPTDINSCVTITKPGSYILANDIVYSGPSNGTCISVMVSNVSINLDGHTMSWFNRSGVPIAIQSANDIAHVVVQNGTISGFGSAVQLFGAGSTVKDVHVGGPCPCNGVGIEAIGVIEDNVVSVQSVGGGGMGIHAAGVIKGNYVYDTRGVGISADQHSVITGNTITNTFGIGLGVSCPSTVTQNTITGSAGKNIFLIGDGCVARDNTAP